MFNTVEDFSEWLEISKKFSPEVEKDVFNFIDAFPSATFEDYIKVSNRLLKGQSVETIKKSYSKHTNQDNTKQLTEIVKMSECIEDMIKMANSGSQKGETTHIPIIDECWKWRKGEFTLLTGYNNDGKSLFLRYIALIKGIMDGWVTACYAPEDYPAVSFFDELIHTASGYSTNKDNSNFIGEIKYRKTYEKIKDYFIFLNIRPPENTIENVLNAFIPMIKKNGVKVCIIDPLIKITRPKEYMNNDAQFVAYLTNICTDFARRYNICLILVLHQLTPRLQENGTYAKPDKYSIKYGGNFSDSVDNVIFLHRPESPKDMADTHVRFGSLKIKKQKLVGIPQDVIFKFNRKTNRYTTEKGDDLFDFNHYLYGSKKQLLF